MENRMLPAHVLVLTILALGAVSCAGSRHGDGDGARAPRDLSAIVEPLRESGRLPALGAALVTSDGLEAIGATGVRSWDGDARVTVDDRWHIGSCTKALTATLVARLVERGVLDWDTTVGSVLGPEIHAAWQDVPMLWLLCHRSGADQYFDQDLWERTVARGGSSREQRRHFVTEGLARAPASTPNTETVYSNAGFVVAGAMLEALTDTAWEDLMQREVFEPLGMEDSGFGAPGTPGQLDQPLGHVRAADGWSPVALGPSADNPPLAGPAGTIHTTLADWARFVSAHLRGERGDASYLQPATWKRLHAPGAAGWTYAPGWVADEQSWAGGTCLHHLGSNNHWIAEASLAPGGNFAVLLVTNVGDDAAEEPFRRLLEALVADHAAHADTRSASRSAP